MNQKTNVSGEHIGNILVENDQNVIKKWVVRTHNPLITIIIIGRGERI